jgi:hypothetical protein
MDRKLHPLTGYVNHLVKEENVTSSDNSFRSYSILHRYENVQKINPDFIKALIFEFKGSVCIPSNRKWRDL